MKIRFDNRELESFPEIQSANLGKLKTKENRDCLDSGTNEEE